MMRRPDPVAATCLAPPEAQVPQPSELHALAVYPPGGYPASEIAGFLAPALVEGSTAIVVATAAHRAAILVELRRRGVDVARARSGGRLVELDAATTLEWLRADGPIDAAAFGEVLGPRLAELPADGTGRVFGELVALLAEEGDLSTAGELERIWNAAMVARDFGLCCAYPSSAFAGKEDAAALAQVEEAHGTLLHGTHEGGPGPCRLLGRSREEVQGLRVGDLIPAEIEPEPVMRALRELTPAPDGAEGARATARHDDLVAWTVGVARDMANLLTGVRGYAELVLEAAETEETRALLREILTLAERGGALTARLARGGDVAVDAVGAVSVAKAVQDASPRLERLLGDEVALEIDMPDDLPTAAIDATGLDRALVNLVTNAAEAMPDGGTIAIRARHASAAEVVAPRYDAARDTSGPLRDWVELVVADDGVGMDHEGRRRAFEPLFTSKADRGGVGLGLVSVDSVVRDVGGHVELTSAPGEGTRARLLLPVTD